MATDCDVLICGFGPVGQLLALLLGRRGVSVIAVDESPEPFDLPRAAVVDDEVLRIFETAGIREEVLRDCQVQEEVSFVPARGPALTLLEPDGTLQGQHGLVSIHQPSMEKTITRAVEQLDEVEIRRGCRLERFEDDGSRIEAVVSDVELDQESVVTAGWLVGCDGANSRVRQLLGIEFGGSTFRQRWLVVDVRLDRPLARVTHPHFFGDPERPVVSLPMSPGRHRWEWMLHPGEDEAPFLEPASIRARVEPWLDGEEATVERAVVYTFQRRSAMRWREGRALLAGDAAHLMPPFAGQGFSSGARDAANLAWKLESCIGGAPVSLLDSYESERRPHVEAMSRLAVTVGSFVQTADRRVSLLRDALLRLTEISGIGAWGRKRIKPTPAYGEGTFATRPARLPFRRLVGSQFPQPAAGDGAPEWIALCRSDDDVHRFTEAGIRAKRSGLDGAAEWVLLRPDRFVYAAGKSGDDIGSALDQLRRHLGRVQGASGLPDRSG